MKRLAPQRRLVGEEAEARIRAACLGTTSRGLAEEVEALYLIAAGVGCLVVQAECTRQAVLTFDPGSAIELDPEGDGAAGAASTLDSGITFGSRSALEFAEGATAALRKLRVLARDDDPERRG